MEKLSFGGTVVPSCMLGAGIRGTYGSKLRNFINPLGPRVTNINFSPNSIRSSRVTVTLVFFNKNIVFPGQAEYSYFSTDFRL